MAIPQKVTADALGARNSHHVRLFRVDDEDELTDEVGLILCDNNADENFKALELVHTPQESLKTSSGATEHSDFEPPYSSLEFDDWSLGRGYHDHNKQKSAYLDAKNMFTVKEGYIYPCGEAQLATIPTDYLKLDYRLREVDTGVPPIVLWQREIGKLETPVNAWGSAFYCDDTFTNCNSFHMDMTPVIVDVGYPIRQLIMRIYEVTPATEVDINGDPVCYLPDTTKLISELSIDPISTVELQNGVATEIIWRTDTDFNLTDQLLYYVVLIPEQPLVEQNYWKLDIVDGNIYEWAQEVGAEPDYTVPAVPTATWASTMNCGIHWEFYITGDANDFKAHFAEINRCLHIGIEFLNGDAGMILRNGELGVGYFSTYSAGTEYGKFITVEEMSLVYQNQIIKILEGPGAFTNRDWSRIVSNADEPVEGTTLLLTHQFGLANADETNPSKYVITNSLNFTKVVTDPVIDQPITDILSAMGALYISFGEKKNVHRLRYIFDYLTPEVTIEWVDEQYWSDMMCQQVRAGNNYIWRIRSLLSQIVPANAVNLRDQAIDYVLDFDPEQEIFVGNTEYRINSWAIYGDDPHLWIMKEDKPYEIVAEDVYEFRNSAMSSMIDSRNSRAVIQHDTYLHFAFHEGVQRWHYNGDLLNHGPEVIGPSGLPWLRQGSFAAFAGYGSTLVGAFDAGEQGYSSLLAWNGSGWCELYRSPQIGERILSCYVQSMDGRPVDWLWFSMGSKVMRIPVSSNPLAQMNDDYFYYPFSKSATLDSSWISLGLKDVEKYIKKFRTVAFKAPSFYDIPLDGEGNPICLEPIIDEALTNDPVLNPDGNTYYAEGVTIGWRTDPCQSFTYFTDGIQDPLIMMGETEFNALVDAEAEMIQFRLGIVGVSDRYPIVIDAAVMDSIVRLPHKTQIRLQFRLRDNDTDRLSMPDAYPTVKEKYDLLEEYSQQAAPVWGQIDAKFVGERQFFIDQGSLQVVEKLRDQNIETWVMTMVLKEA